MFVGGTLIRRFDGFRRLCRQAALEFHHQLSLPDGDLLLANRVLAGLGGPPAAPEVRGSFTGDGLPLLLLFLLTQEIPCRAGLLGRSDPHLGRLKSLAHLLGHAAYPVLTGGPPLSFQEVVREIGASGARMRPVLTYDAEGEPVQFRPEGAVASLGVGPDQGPYTLAVLLGPTSGPAPLLPSSPASEADESVPVLHPTVLHLA